MHPLTKIRIHWNVKGREYEIYTDARRFREQVIIIFEDVVDKVETIYYTINKTTHQLDYYNLKELK